MEITLAENIRLNRKQRKLTQEQFAEIMGVTAGAVYKWESALSVPELSLIVEMARFFDCSVDALLGYRMDDSSMEAACRRIETLMRSRDTRAMTEAETALAKYPNSFTLVHICAMVYYAFGAGSHDSKTLWRALELMEQSLVLLPQNTDASIGETTIYGDIAGIYILLGETEKGLEILKSHNTAGIFDEAIGMDLAVFTDRSAEAEPYLSQAFFRCMTSLLDIVSGYAVVYFSKSEYGAVEEILLWMKSAFSGLRRESSRGVSLKMYAGLLATLASALNRNGKRTEAETTLREAASLAEEFDASPDYGANDFRFISLPEGSLAYDTLGATAEESIFRLMDLLKDDEMKELWKEIRKNG